jgi:hypothetical protein
MRDTPDEYGHIGMIVEQQTEAERLANLKSTILGNAKNIVKKELPQEKKDEAIIGLSF